MGALVKNPVTQLFGMTLIRLSRPYDWTGRLATSTTYLRQCSSVFRDTGK
jgi:hypothetical protein